MAEPRLTGAVLLLGLTQIVGYGTLYYSFSVLGPDTMTTMDFRADRLTIEVDARNAIIDLRCG